MQKLGVLGGTFDPIHEGHIALARAAITHGQLDQVVFLPMARPAHRDADASAADRLAMCHLAVEKEQGLAVSQAGMAPGVRYTQDTIAHLKREFPGAKLTLIIGADKLPSLPYWYQAVFTVRFSLFSQKRRFYRCGAGKSIGCGSENPFAARLSNALFRHHDQDPNGAVYGCAGPEPQGALLYGGAWAVPARFFA